MSLRALCLDTSSGGDAGDAFRDHAWHGGTPHAAGALAPGAGLRGRAQCYAAVAALLALDRLLHAACGALRITFPSALIGAALGVAVLLALPPAAAERTMAWLRPGVHWVARRWLPLFYSPALVTLPLAISPLSGVTLAKAVAVVCLGAPMVLAVAASVAVWIRRATGTELQRFAHHLEPLSFSRLLWAAWAGLAAAALLGAVLLATLAPPPAPPALQQQQQQPVLFDSMAAGAVAGTKHALPAHQRPQLLQQQGTAAAAAAATGQQQPEQQRQQQEEPKQARQQEQQPTPALPSTAPPLPPPLHLAASAFLLSCTVLGYLAGMALPLRAQLFVQPMLVAAAVANAGCVLLGTLPALSGGAGAVAGYWRLLQGYLTKGAGGVYGPGDLLFAFLGVFEQRQAMRRHAPELLGACTCAALFSLLSTAGMAALAGLPPPVARGLVPRSATMALALPIADSLGAPAPFCAMSVALTALVGANLAPQLLTALRFRDPVARGIAAAAAAHGLGTAALSSQEPETLPFCGLSYALTGSAATLLAALPPLRQLLLAITG
eukprot:scaffold10.g2295.t1